MRPCKEILLEILGENFLTDPKLEGFTEEYCKSLELLIKTNNELYEEKMKIFKTLLVAESELTEEDIEQIANECKRMRGSN